MSDRQGAPRAAIIGGGFCGLAAALELSRRGAQVTVFERDPEIGGLAGSFPVGGAALEKFYHHWFTNDRHIMGLIDELGAAEEVVARPTRTGMYYANRFYRLSSPLDLLRFEALPLIDRLRLGLLTLRARRVSDWHRLESLTAAEWLRAMGGERVFEVVWEPLLRGKFGDFADEVSAVWFWNKLKLRGGSRGKGGEERLAYFRGGFAALAQRIAERIEADGGRILTATGVDGLEVEQGRVNAVVCGGQRFATDAVIATPALPLVADLLNPHVEPDYAERLRRIRWLGNVCLVLKLDRSLSSTYWLNVNDPDFPFVGVIEHTNFEPTSAYGGHHIVYLSKYLPVTESLYRMADDELLDFTLPHLRRMFPDFKREWIQDYHVWRAAYSQPVVERHYSTLIPPRETPLSNLYLGSMAQIYPEDRGTNYAVREGRRVGEAMATTLGLPSAAP
ncbi:NAD(P)/FAD-dependent oxidoreductase [Endothiovibrio diazotrophicus]